MSNPILVAKGISFPSGSFGGLQTEVADVRYYGVTSVGFPGTVAFVVIPTNFTPNLPAGITVIPWIRTYMGEAFSTSPGGTASVFGFDMNSGSPFGGTVLGRGVFQNVAINDQLNLSGDANSAGGGSGTGNYVIEAILKI